MALYLSCFIGFPDYDPHFGHVTAHQGHLCLSVLEDIILHEDVHRLDREPLRLRILANPIRLSSIVNEPAHFP
jgi:hypothetical protein